MKPTLPDRGKFEVEGDSTEPGYEDWKRSKVERGLAQSRVRESLIPVEQIWNDLKLER